ncbi:hypothetical protein [Streptomyces liliifuscus]|uniref:Uncharacterized protein n=1 Tax=Streptomyces liliifuscus TaxID=2797636 RepID=A0A7T7RDW3_9ACTN|nr:hypothetical protein [Streptomyces liliifuscus]QQM43169.1 hypothetical protein JEQ17_29690 [Streptomyces liliifuscus]
MAVSKDFAEVCQRAADFLNGLDGYFLERVSLDTGRANSGVDIFLRVGPTAPDVVISLTGVVSAVIGNFLEMDSAFIDEIRLEYVSGSEPSWPGGLSGLGARPSGFPGVAWLTIDGPMPVEVVAKAITVSVAQVY